MNNNTIISYMTFRKVLGIIGMALPFALVIGGEFGGWTPMETSMSMYFHSICRDLFTGGLISFGIFLLCYRGYDNKDRALTIVAGTAIIIVAFFPCYPGYKDTYLFQFIGPEVSGWIHNICAIITFGSMGLMSLFQFPQHDGSPTTQKLKRNNIYRICGIIILADVVLMPIVGGVPAIRNATNSFRLFYIMETIVLLCFGFSWIVKGQMLLKDK